MSLFGPAQRHTHFKGAGSWSNAVGAGRWWMYTTLSMAPLPSSVVLFMFFASSSYIDYKTWILMWINEAESKWSYSWNKSYVGIWAQALLDPVPSVLKVNIFQGLSQTKCSRLHVPPLSICVSSRSSGFVPCSLCNRMTVICEHVLYRWFFSICQPWGEPCRGQAVIDNGWMALNHHIYNRWSQMWGNTLKCSPKTWNLKWPRLNSSSCLLP